MINDKVVRIGIAATLFFHIFRSSYASVPCGEIHRDLSIPCRCDVEPIPSLEQGIGILMDCDKVQFHSDVPQLPHRAPIVGFSQRFVGHQNLPSNLFGRQELPMMKLDFSHNSLRRLPDQVFGDVAKDLEELYLSDNLLGDNLNPIFASPEFHILSQLKVLDLSGNFLRGIEEGIFRGCTQLQILRLSRNLFKTLPTNSLNGLDSLQAIFLQGNKITTVETDAFSGQPSLKAIRLDENLISDIHANAFFGLSKLEEISLARNKIVQLNSEVFAGVSNLEKIDLSENFLAAMPLQALKVLPFIKHLNVSSNQIQTLEPLPELLEHLEVLDLSRNNIALIQAGTFKHLRRLRQLDLSVNALRTIEEEAFVDLKNLETLSLEDNNILLVPSSALGHLRRLNILNLSYNRISAISYEILKVISKNVTWINLANNVIREIPAESFKEMRNVKRLDLGGNLLSRLNGDTFEGLEDSLEILNLQKNKLSTFTGRQLAFPNLKSLDLSSNELSEMSTAFLQPMQQLKYLNLSGNENILLPSTFFHQSLTLTTLDLSRCGLHTVHPDLFSNSRDLKVLILAGNLLQNISDTVFRNLRNLTYLDLTDNRISNMRSGALGYNLNLKVLLLDKNYLNAFKGEYFKAGKGEFKNFTSIEFLGLSDNELTYLFPSSFKIHPKLKVLNAFDNKFTYFPAELISNMQFLEKIDLGKNKLKTIEDMDFSRLPRLQELLLNDNEIESISESAFHNSTQLQLINLSGNKITRISERTFEGLITIKMLNLSRNQLSELPESIFDRSKFKVLEGIDLAQNQFKHPPLKSLQRQYFFLNFLNLSHNGIQEISSDDVTMVNIKSLDLSHNPLTKEAISSILTEPKTVRNLRLAATGIGQMATLEMPFLKTLDISHNEISVVEENVFQRSTLLEEISFAHNAFENFENIRLSAWNENLRRIDISNNPIAEIKATDFTNLTMLTCLDMHDLTKVTKIEKNAFKNLPNLRQLKAYGYPRLGYIDVKGLLQYLPHLEYLDIELKDKVVSSDELTSVMHPRLKYLGLRGNQIVSISAGIFAGLKSPVINLKLINTSVNTLPQGLFFPLPRSSDIAFNVAGSSIKTLSSQFLSMFEDNRKGLIISGLDSNPITCDCNSTPLRRWLLNKRHINIVCSEPEFKGEQLRDIPEEELCSFKKPAATLETSVSTSSPTSTATKLLRKTTTSEPEIIWTAAPKKKANTNLKVAPSPTIMNNDDMLIISIVGGVVAFIVILVIVICIIRLRMVNNVPYRGGPLAAAAVPYPPSVYSLKPGVNPPPSLYMAPTYATLPQKVMGPVDAHSTLKPYTTMRPPSQLQSYYQNSSSGQSAYYIPYTPDEKIEYR